MIGANSQPCDIRELVGRTFQELGATIGSLADLDEKLLIDEGRCAARSYAAGGLMAMWLVEVGIVQFYDAEGKMLRTVSLLDESGGRRMAA